MTKKGRKREKRKLKTNKKRKEEGRTKELTNEWMIERMKGCRMCNNTKASVIRLFREYF